MISPRAFLVIVFLTVFAPTADIYAAFPVHPKANTIEAVVHTKTDIDFKTLVNSEIERFTQKPAPVSTPDGGNVPWLGIASFITGVTGLAALGLTIIFSPLFLGVTVLAGIAAIIMGAKGIRRPQRGFAVAGLVLGIVDLALLLFAALFLLFLYMIFSEIRLKDVM